jgi:hypothetical protein
MLPLLSGLKAGIYLALIGLLVSLSILSFRASCLISSTNKQISSVNLAQSQKLLDEDLVRIRDLTTDVHKAVFQVNQESALEQKYLVSWNQQVSAAMTNTNSLLVSLKTTSDGLNNSQTQVAEQSVVLLKNSQSAVTGLQTVETSLNSEVGDLQEATKSLNTLAQDPDIKTTINGLAGTSQNLKATTSDVQQAVHSYFHPTWPQRIMHGIIDAGTTIAKFFVG